MKEFNNIKKFNSRIFVFEGIDHVGKSTVIDLVKNKLEFDYGLESIVIPFPGKDDGTLGGLVYDIHHNNKKYFKKNLNDVSLQLLHVASHIDNIFTKIIPAMNNGKIILLDRFWWSTVAYGIANGIPQNLLEQVIAPELFYWKYISIDKYFLLKRDNKDIDYQKEIFNSICETYDKLCKKNHNAYVIFNNGTLDETVKMIINHIIDYKGDLL